MSIEHVDVLDYAFKIDTVRYDSSSCAHSLTLTCAFPGFVYPPFSDIKLVAECIRYFISAIMSSSNI